MYPIDKLTNDPLQERSLVLPDGTVISITLYFIQNQQGWFITELTYNNQFTLRGLRITNQPDMLYQFRNQIPFGLACFSTADREPSLLEDFSSGNSQLFILSQEEVDVYSGILRGG